MAGNDAVNLYELLGVTRESSEKEIIKAFRKKALVCHPDKNPDSAAAAQLFHEISEALKILTDKKAKAAYDAVLKAKELAKLRTQAFDSKRKKFKQDLEARETSAQKANEEEQNIKSNLAAEIKRLREEGSRLLREQQDSVRTQIEKEEKLRKSEAITPKIKVKWKSSKTDHDNGGYNEDVLKRIFQKYGHIIDVIVAAKKNGLAIVEFKNPAHAVMALEFEHGLEENPLKISWLQGPKMDSYSESSSNEAKISAAGYAKVELTTSNVAEENLIPDDFEASVLQRMKLAQQKKCSADSK